MAKTKTKSFFRTGRLNLLATPRFNLAVLGIIMATLSSIGYFMLTHSFAAGTALYLAPASGNLAPNGLLNVAIRISTDQQVRTVRVALPYPTSMLQYVSDNGSGSAFTIGAGASDNSGTLYITRTVSSGSSVTGDQLFTTLTFRVIAASGTVALNFSPYPSTMALRASDNQNVLTSTSGGSYAIATTPPPPPTPPAVAPPPVAPPPVTPPPAVTPPVSPTTRVTPSPPVTHVPPPPPASPITKLFKAVMPPPAPTSTATKTPSTNGVSGSQSTNTSSTEASSQSGSIDPTTGQFFDSSQVDASAGPQWPPTTIAAVAVLSTAIVVGLIWFGLRWWDRRRSY